MEKRWPETVAVTHAIQTSQEKFEFFYIFDLALVETELTIFFILNFVQRDKTIYTYLFTINGRKTDNNNNNNNNIITLDRFAAFQCNFTA